MTENVSELVFSKNSVPILVFREGRAWRYEPPHWSHQQVVEGDDYRRWKEEHRH